MRPDFLEKRSRMAFISLLMKLPTATVAPISIMASSAASTKGLARMRCRVSTVKTSRSRRSNSTTALPARRWIGIPVHLVRIGLDIRIRTPRQQEQNLCGSKGFGHQIRKGGHQISLGGYFAENLAGARQQHIHIQSVRRREQAVRDRLHPTVRRRHRERHRQGGQEVGGIAGIGDHPLEQEAAQPLGQNVQDHQIAPSSVHTRPRAAARPRPPKFFASQCHRPRIRS